MTPRPRKTWKQRIGKRLTAHVVEYCGGTVRCLKRQIEGEDAGLIVLRCYECDKAARKLGLRK